MGKGQLGYILKFCGRKGIFYISNDTAGAGLHSNAGSGMTGKTAEMAILKSEVMCKALLPFLGG